MTMPLVEIRCPKCDTHTGDVGVFTDVDGKWWQWVSRVQPCAHYIAHEDELVAHVLSDDPALAGARKA